MRYHFGSCFFTKQHLKFGENQADNLAAVFNRFILDFGAFFSVFYWFLVLYTLCPLSIVILILLFDQSAKNRRKSHINLFLTAAGFA